MSPNPFPVPADGLRAELALGALSGPVAARLAEWERDRLSARIWQRDHTVWSARPVPELVDRLGWLSLPTAMATETPWLEHLARQIRAMNCRHLILLGMGGSSLAPELFQATFGNRPDCPALAVLDSTHPASVSSLLARVDPREALIVVSSKSGTTIETQAGLALWWDAVAAADPAPGHRFVAITDPGTPLEAIGNQRGFRAVIAAPPDVGGRYSALSVFGLVPAAFIGAPVTDLLASAARMAGACGPGVHAADHPGLVLGACLAEAAIARRDKLVLLASPGLEALPAWLEQLVAESTGKNGRGIVPVAGEAPEERDDPPADRMFVCLSLDGDAPAPGASQLDRLALLGHPVVKIGISDRATLGAEMFRWEFAVAAASARLGVQPFDQPDVQIAKDLARRAMAARREGTGAAVFEPGVAIDAADARSKFEQWLASIGADHYVSIQAFLPWSPGLGVQLARLRRGLVERAHVATTLGIGPRFLHSTGQLHKGGPAAVSCLQLVDDAQPDVVVPGAGYTFGELVGAQALGDFEALSQRGRRVLRIKLGSDGPASLQRLADWVG